MHKLTLSLLVVVLVAVLGLGWTLDSLFDRYSAPVENDALLPYREAGLAVARILDSIDDPENWIKTNRFENNLSFSIKSIQAFLLPDEIKSEFMTGKPLALESDEGISLNFILPRTQQVLTLNSPGMRDENNNNSLRLIFTMLFYLGILSLLLIWIYPLIKQLIQLRETAKALGQGDLSQRVASDSVSYISEIETEFNRMAQRIQILVTDNKLLSSAVSHDLRTPLARLRFGIDTLAEASDPILREKYQRRISEDLTEMEALVETLLNYARMDASMIELQKSSIDLGQVVRHCIARAAKNDLNIAFRHGAKIATISGDERYLSMLVNNLLQNAIRHAKKEITLSLKLNNRDIVLGIEDDGPGIPEHERTTVLKPFIRGSNANASEGYGMGLAIAQRIAVWHGGNLEIEQSTFLGGAKLQITFHRDGQP